MQAFDRVGGVNDPSYFRREGKERYHLLPVPGSQSRARAFPNDEAATKLIWLALRNITAKWNRPPIAWHAAKVQFAIQFEDRFVMPPT